jgi:hypothetical protein
MAVLLCCQVSFESHEVVQCLQNYAVISGAKSYSQHSPTHLAYLIEAYLT